MQKSELISRTVTARAGQGRDMGATFPGERESITLSWQKNVQKNRAFSRVRVL